MIKLWAFFCGMAVTFGAIGIYWCRDLKLTISIRSDNKIKMEEEK